MGICPRVALESAPLKGHESILKTFSKGPFRPSRGTEAHLVLPLKTSLAHKGREYNVLPMWPRCRV